MALVLLAATVAVASAQKPNIWFILSDDQGYNNIGLHNPDLITPNINQLVAEGRELTRHYVYKFCSPTRTSLISGRLPIHVNQENSATSQPYAGIPAAMTTIAERLSQANYSCHQVGKWHCGQATKQLIPHGRGFNTSLGFFNFGEDHYTQIRGAQALHESDTVACEGVDLWKTDKPAYGINGTYGGYIYTAEAIRVIEEKPANMPLFLFTAFQNIHPPLQVPESYIKRYSNASLQTTVNGMVTFLDESIGNVTAVLRQQGLWDNTLIVFSADNGGYLGNGGDDAPRRGGKFSDFEGGVRVNSFISGGLVPAAVRGTKVSGMVHICDWYATFLHLAGVNNIYDQRAANANLSQPDSINVWDLVSGANNTSPRFEVILSLMPTQEEKEKFDTVMQLGHHYRDPMYFVGGEAIIVGDMKLILGDMHRGPFGPHPTKPCDSFSPPWSGLTNPGLPCTCGTSGCLFNVTNDPNEEHDLASSDPGTVMKLKAKLDAARPSLYAPDRGAMDPKACDEVKNSGGFWGPWL
eukprot:m.11904 g.11904  ORF g.11904 m.11904 type:complete len:523 (+) comp4552_c0_seq1:170-1738(+)